MYIYIYIYPFYIENTAFHVYRITSINSGERFNSNQVDSLVIKDILIKRLLRL